MASVLESVVQCVLGLRIANGLVMVPLMLLAPLIRSKPQAADPYIYMGGLVFLVVRV
ncbi:hypothetical protein [Celeribacter halophilus]|uniref:hypothetical protein n=1 Tax=Celeribacter halophilus TaxID=576117 RepID=UPI003A8C9C59